MSRQAEVKRKTGETDIQVILDLDGQGVSRISTGIGFFDHMLDALTRHSGINLSIEAKGDLHVDEHHTVEDVGLALGEALKIALGDKKGIARFGWAYCPLDEALCRAVIDLSGRPSFVWQAPVNLHLIGEMHSETVPEFFRALCNTGGITLHLDMIRGQNLHHVIEAMFKAFAKALQQAIASDGNNKIPSTKGVLA